MTWNNDVQTRPVGSRVRRSEDLQCLLLELIDKNPGITGAELASQTNSTPEKVYNLLRPHRSDGSIVTDRQGRSKKVNKQKALRYYSNPDLIGITAHLSIGSINLEKAKERKTLTT